MAAPPTHTDANDRFPKPEPANYDDSEFAHLEPLLVTFADLADGPRRRELRDRLITSYLPLAQRLAVKFRDRGVPGEDLMQLASLGLVNAVDRYDPHVGSPFLAFAVPTIQGEIRRHFRDRTWSMKVSRGLKDRYRAITKASSELTARSGRAPRPSEIATHLQISVDEVIEGLNVGEAYTSTSLDHELHTADGPGGASLTDILGRADKRLDEVVYRHTLRPLLEELTEQERAILMLRFFSDMTQSEIAAEIGTSQMHVSRQLTKVLASLRRKLERD